MRGISGDGTSLRVALTAPPRINYVPSPEIPRPSRPHNRARDDKAFRSAHNDLVGMRSDVAVLGRIERELG